MARHSHWHQIRLKKGAADKKRGKIFTQHARLIEIAARAGGDPGSNPTLRFAIDNARTDNVPNDNIERAIKKGTGALKDALQMEEVMYEGYAPGGVALLIEAITENKNRTSQQVRNAFSKTGGNFGSSGSTAFLFDQKAEILVRRRDGKSLEEDQLDCIDSGAEDIQEGAMDELLLYGDPAHVGKLRDAISERGFSVKRAARVYVRKNPVEITDVRIARQIIDLIDALEEIDDVLRVSSSAEMNDEVMENIVLSNAR